MRADRATQRAYIIKNRVTARDARDRRGKSPQIDASRTPDEALDEESDAFLERESGRYAEYRDFNY